MSLYYSSCDIVCGLNGICPCEERAKYRRAVKWFVGVALFAVLSLGWVVVANADIPRKHDYIQSAKAMEWKHGVQRGLLQAVCEQESRWNPLAISRKGALGLCQIMPDTFTELIKDFQRNNGLEVDGVIGPKTWAKWRPGVPYKRMHDRARLLDPFQNVEWAAYYLDWIKHNVSADPAVMFGTYYAGQRHQVVRYQLEVLSRWDRGGI